MKSLNQFKLEVAQEIGIKSYDTIDKGALTSRENGLVGGTMVKKIVDKFKTELR